MRILTVAFTGLLVTGLSQGRAGVVNFQDQTLPASMYDNGAGHSPGFSGFTSGGAFLNNSYNSAYGSWTGWSISSVDNTGTDYNPAGGVYDYSGNHQYASASGLGADTAPRGGPADPYAVGYADGYDPTYINLPNGTRPTSVKLNNTTYDVLSMKNGDSFAKNSARLIILPRR